MDHNKKKIPIGFDRFKKIRKESFFYIDKTGMIKDLLLSWSEVNLFTRLRRFGKSLNIGMLKTFLRLALTPHILMVWKSCRKPNSVSSTWENSLLFPSP
ncbi:MAG: AAA family ATPase [Lachnospiraceae bacterium]|nr:AAA family ATPase [Lachnospiraceae bacterium]